MPTYYKLISANSTWELSKEVNNYLAEGWDLHGSVAVCQNGSHTWYYQPMTKTK